MMTVLFIYIQANYELILFIIDLDANFQGKIKVTMPLMELALIGARYMTVLFVYIPVRKEILT